MYFHVISKFFCNTVFSYNLGKSATAPEKDYCVFGKNTQFKGVAEAYKMPTVLKTFNSICRWLDCSKSLLHR